jgi:hypothetical protein
MAPILFFFCLSTPPSPHPPPSPHLPPVRTPARYHLVANPAYATIAILLEEAKEKVGRGVFRSPLPSPPLPSPLPPGVGQVGHVEVLDGLFG